MPDKDKQEIYPAENNNGEMVDIDLINDDYSFKKLEALADSIYAKTKKAFKVLGAQDDNDRMLQSIKDSLNAIKKSSSGAEILDKISRKLELSNLSADDIKSPLFSSSFDLKHMQGTVLDEENKLNGQSLFLKKLSQLANAMKEKVSKASSYLRRKDSANERTDSPSSLDEKNKPNRSSVQRKLFEFANVIKEKVRNASFCLRRKDSANEGDRKTDSRGDTQEKRERF